MTTPNSSPDQAMDVHDDPAFAAQFESAPGETLLPNRAVPQWNEEPASEPASCNVGRTEQQIRLVTGAALATAAVVAPLGRGWRIALGALGAMELVTGSTRFCPLWKALHINTCTADER